MNGEQGEDSEHEDSKAFVLVKQFIHPVWSNNFSEFKAKKPVIS